MGYVTHSLDPILLRIGCRCRMKYLDLEVKPSMMQNFNIRGCRSLYGYGNEKSAENNSSFYKYSYEKFMRY